MSNKAVFEVQVTDKGSKIVKKNVDDLGTSVRKTRKSTDELATSQTRAAKAGKEHNSALNGGVASANNAARSMSKLVSSVGDNNSGLVAAYAILATNAFAVGAAFNTLRSAAQVELLLKGLEVQGSRTGRNLLGISNSIQEITKGSLSAADAMKAASLGSASGLNAADLEALTTVATNASIALGRNLPDSMDRVIKGVTKLEPELLDELGLMTKLTEATEKYARSQGKSAESLTGLEKRRAFIEAIKAEGEIKYAGISEQVDVNSFDQLAATFMNLTNSVLGFIAASRPVQVILDLLINTSLGLVSALTFLASTMSGPINNWLHGMATASAKAAAELADVAAAQQKVADTAVDASKGRLDRANAAATEAAAMSKKQPAAFRTAELKRSSGEILSLEERDRAIKSLERSTAAYAGKIDKLRDLQDELISSGKNLSESDKNKIKVFNEEIAVNAKRIEAYRELSLASEDLANRTNVAMAQQSRAAATKFEQISKEKAGLALQAAGNIAPTPEGFKALKTTAKEVAASIAAYNQQLTETTKASIATATATGRSATMMQLLAPAVNTTRVAFYGLGLSIRAVGSAVMAALPYLGLIMLAISGAQMLYEKFFVTEGEKAKAKALEELKTATDSVANSIKELNRLNNVDMQQGLKASRLMEIKLNSLLELAEAYKKLMEAATEASRQEEREQSNAIKANEALRERLRLINEQRSRTNSTVGNAIAAQQERVALYQVQNRQDLADQAGVSFDSRALDVFGPKLKKGIFSGFNEEGVEAIRILTQLEEISPEVAKKFYDNAKATDSTETNMRKLGAALDWAAKQFNPLRDKLAEFTEALKAAETAQADFLKSLRPTTPYDNIASNISSLSSSMNDLETLMKEKGSIAASQFTGSFQQIITQLGPNLSSALNAEGQITLSSYNAIGDEIAKLNEMKRDGVNVENELAAATAQRAQYESRLGELIPTQVDAYADLLASAQQQHILAGSQITMAQARLSLIQRQGIVVGADARKQMDAQNAVIAAQQAQERIKLTFIKLDLQRIELTVSELKAQQEILKVFSDRIASQEKLNRLTELADIRTERRRLILEGKGGSPEAVRLAAEESTLLRMPELNAASVQEEQRRNASALRAAERSRAIILAGARSVETAIAAMGMGAFSEAEKAAAEAKQNLANLRESKTLERERIDLLRNRAQIERRIATTMSGNIDTLRDELAIISENAEARRNQISDEFLVRSRELNVDIALATRRGNAEQVRYYQELLRLITAKKDAELDSIEAAAREESLNKVLLKGAEDYINRLTEAANIRQRMADAAAQERAASASLFNAISDLDVARRGITDSQAVDRLRNIREARENLDRIREEASIKQELITLEFELLKAKRAQTIADLTLSRSRVAEERENLASRRDAAAAALATAETAQANARRAARGGSESNGDLLTVTAGIPGDSPEVALARSVLSSTETQLAYIDSQQENLDAILQSWSTTTDATFDRGAESLRRALDIGVQEAAVRLEIALTNGPRVTDGLSADFENIQARASVVVEAIDTVSLQAGVAMTNAQRLARGEVALTTEEIRHQIDELTRMGEASLRASGKLAGMGSRVFRFLTDEVTSYSQKVAEAMRALGPEGEVVSAVVLGASAMANAFLDFSTKLSKSVASSDLLISGLQMAAAAISMVSNILKSSSDSRIANIDREIEAEQKRDGKSSASVERIKQMEKKKEEIAKKSFETQKKLQMASVVVNTAAAAIGIAASLAQLGPPGLAMIPAAVGMMVALGAAQLALIAGTSYQSQSSTTASANTQSLSIGKRADSVNLASGANANAGGEIGYLRGSQGFGSNASNYRTIGSAYGGNDLMRGYGNRGFIVGEKGPERIDFDTPISVTPASDTNTIAPVNATINIQALDGADVKKVLVDQRGNIIQMLREAANSSGQGFMEDVNVNVFTRPSIGKL